MQCPEIQLAEIKIQASRPFFLHFEPTVSVPKVKQVFCTSFVQRIAKFMSLIRFWISNFLMCFQGRIFFFFPHTAITQKASNSEHVSGGFFQALSTLMVKALVVSESSIQAITKRLLSNKA